MDELYQIMETAKSMAVKLECRELVPDNAHVAQVWHCMALLAHHCIELNSRLEQQRAKR